MIDKFFDTEKVAYIAGDNEQPLMVNLAQQYATLCYVDCGSH